ncbi:hypothetical protein [Hymenobacter chitinivorans]|uniref:DUF3298 domain-containing protein n=1 Tax=Hymenobacter chitinivorans DSM 11115 TaxID=1121954 RepID=A0A2M9BQM4_9BACT|nr:hypothetical protein [Hymenobacter chitinivorans]PJJ60227.1 hypothetical protein CLV45_1652 [Hymenobacter chitinivorans DSM 11115]
MNRIRLLLVLGLLSGRFWSAAQGVTLPPDSSRKPVLVPVVVDTLARKFSLIGPLDSAARPNLLAHERYPGPRRLRGTIGKQSVTVELDSANGSYVGGFYYDRAGRWLEVRLDARRGARTLNLCETPAGDLTGRLRLPTKAAAQLKGTWENADGRHQYPFVLRETYAGAAHYEQDLWEMWRYTVRRDTSYIPRDSAFFHQLYVRVSLPQNPGAEQRLRRALAAPFAPDLMPLYLDTLLARRQQQYNRYQFHSYSDVVYNGNNLLSVMRVTSFQQGPYYEPHEWYDGATFDLRTGQRLRLPDLLVADYKKRLLELFRRGLKRALAAAPGYGPLGGPAPKLPTGGFVLAPAGLVFTYDDRDAPTLSKPLDDKADRFLEVVLPYEELLPLIRRKGPLAPVLRERGLLPKK